MVRFLRYVSRGALTRSTPLSIGIALLATFSAAAQEGVTLAVVTGAGGTVRAGAMAPVHVTAHNPGPSISAVVTLHWLSGAQPRPNVTEFRALELPQNSTKRITLYSEPGRLSTKVLVTLREYEPGTNPNTGAKLAEFSEDISVMDAETPVLGVIGPPFGALPRPTDKDGKDWGSRFYFSDQVMPDDPRGWEMCDAIVYTPETQTTPSAAELSALRDWVFQGGDLVVVAAEPAEVFASPGFRGFLPYVPSGQQQRAMGLFNAEMIHSVGRVEDGEVLLRDADTPLVIRRAFGLGSVSMLTFDPSGSAFAQSSMVIPIWRQTLPELFFIPPDDWFSMSFGQLDTLTDAALKSITQAPDVRIQLFVVVLLIGLYALAVGPGDYLLARRHKRPMLTWITFPSMVLVFTSVAFLGARVWVGGDEEVRAHRSITYFPEGVLYNETLSYFASMSKNYQIAHPTGSPLRTLTNSMDTPDIALMDGDSEERLQRIPTWSARAFTTVRTVDTACPVDFDVAPEDDGYRLSVTNTGSDTIRVTALTVDKRHFVIRPNEIASLGPGDTFAIPVAARRGSDTRSSGSGGGINEIWNAPTTRAPRFRSWDHRAVVERGDTVLTFEIVEPAAAAIAIDGRRLEATATIEQGHAVKPNASIRTAASAAEESP